MAGLSVGELAARLGLDDDEFDNGLEGARGRFDGLGQHLQTAALGIAAGAGLALAAGMAEAMDMQAVDAKLQASLGLTAEESARMGDVAGALYADAYGDSLADVGTAVQSVVQNIRGMGDVSSAELEDVTAEAMSLAQVMGVDVADATAAVGTMLANNLAPNAQTAMDVLAAGTQAGANKAGDLLDTFSEYSPVFTQLGLSGEQAMGLLSQGVKAGARDTDFLADALKEFTILVQEMPEATSSSFAALGLDARQMQAAIAAGGPAATAALDQITDALRQVKDPAEQNAIAVGLFGTKAEDLQQTLFAMDPSTAVDALGSVEGAADTLDQALSDTTKNSLESLKREFMVGLGGALESVLPKIQTATNWISDHSGTIKAVAIPVVAALGAGLLVMGAQAAAAWVMALGPVGLAVAGIVAAVALIVANWDSIKAAAQAVWGAISAAWGAVADFFANLGPRVVGFFADAGSWLLEAGKAILNGLWEGVKFVAELLFFWYVELPTKILGFFADAAMWLFDKGKDILSGLWNGAKNVWDAYILWVSNIYLWIGEKFANAKDWLFDKGRDVLSGLWNGAKEIWQTYVGWVQNIRQWVVDKFSDAGRWLYDAGKSILSGLWNGMKDKWGEVSGWVGGLGGKIRNLKGPPTRDAVMLTEAGNLIMGSLGDGLASGWPAIERQLTGMTSKIQGAGAGMGLSASPAADYGFSGTGAPTQIFVTVAGPVYDIHQMGQQLAPTLQRTVRDYARNNAGDNGFVPA